MVWSDTLVFTLSVEQFAAFEGHTRDDWCRSAARALFESYGAHYTGFGTSAEALSHMVQSTAAWALRHDIRSQADVTRLCHVAASLGHRFWQDPRFQGYVSASTSPEIPPGRRATAMMGETKSWLRGLWAGDSLQAFSERLSEMIAAGHGPETQTLRYVLPGHWQLFHVADVDRLLGWLGQSTPELLQDTGPRQLAFTACALVHGPQWLSDPQYPRLANLIRMELDPAVLATELEGIYAEATA